MKKKQTPNPQQQKNPTHNPRQQHGHLCYPKTEGNMPIYFNTKIKTISKRWDRRRAPVIQNIAYSAFNVSVLEAARFCYSYKDLDSGAKNTLWKGRCPCFCFIDSLTMSSTSTHGTLGFFQIQKIPGVFFCRKSWKRNSCPRSQKLPTNCKPADHCNKCFPHICPNQPKWQHWNQLQSGCKMWHSVFLPVQILNLLHHREHFLHLHLCIYARNV